MFEIWQDQGKVIHLEGMLVAGKSEKAEQVLDGVTQTTTLDFANLKHISSSGLGLLVKVQRRLDRTGHKIRIINCNDHIREVFSVTHFDMIFDIE